MILTTEDIGAIKVAIMEELEPRFAQIDERFTEINQKIDDQTHKANVRFTAIEVRLDSIEYKLGQIAVFVPFQNAYLLPSARTRKND